jgi:hypothetical protein
MGRPPACGGLSGRLPNHKRAESPAQAGACPTKSQSILALMRIFLRILLIVGVVYALFLGGLGYAMRQPPDTFGAVMAKMPMVAFLVMPFETLWMSARAGHLQVGDAAPDFTLKSPDGASQVQLSSYRGSKPVVLIFGSYT